MEATKKAGAPLQAKYNEVANEALGGEKLGQSERRKIVGLVRYSDPETFDAMLRCRMSKEQLADELPARAKRAGFTEVSRYVRWVLFGSGEPNVPVSAAPVEVRDNWNEAIEKAIEEVKSVGGRPRLDSVLAVLEKLKR
jgi:hypothetical protein